MGDIAMNFDEMCDFEGEVLSEKEEKTLIEDIDGEELTTDERKDIAGLLVLLLRSEDEFWFC